MEILAIVHVAPAQFLSPVVATPTPVQPEAALSPKAAPQREIRQVHRINLRAFLLNLGGAIVSLDFVKNDGQDRSMVCRLGVRKHLKGGVNTVEGADRPYLTMFDMQKQGYRAVNLSTVTQVRANGQVYDVLG